MTEHDKRMIASYARSFISAALAVYMTGETSWSAMLAAGVAAVVPPLLRWLNPNDPGFGRGSQEKDSGQ